MALSVHQFAVHGLDDNLSYVIYDDASGEAVLIDPSGEIEQIFDWIRKQNATMTGIWLTHTHHDHYDRLADAMIAYPDAPVLVHELGYEKLEQADLEPITHHETLSVGDGEVVVYHTPGHIDDAVCFYITAEQAVDGVPKLITGDTLFVEGCGRTTEASVATLYESLQSLKHFPDETEVYPGHDYGSKPVSTIGHEMAHNRFLVAPDRHTFTQERLG